MASGTFNIAMGREAEYGSLPGSDDALILVLLRGVESDSLLRQHDTLASVLGSNTECNFTGYSRIELSTTFVVSDALGTPILDASDPSDIDPAGNGTNNAIVKALVCYDPDTTGGTDSTIVPMFFHDAAIATDGNALQFDVAGDGLWRHD